MTHEEQVAHLIKEFRRIEHDLACKASDKTTWQGIAEYVVKREAALHKEYEQRDEQGAARVQETGEAIAAFLIEHNMHCKLMETQVTQLHDCLLEFVSKREAALTDQIEQLRVQLAGCSVAAVDSSEANQAQPGSYGWSVSYRDVQELKKKYDTTQKVAEAARAIEEYEGVQAGRQRKISFISVPRDLLDSLRSEERRVGKECRL